MILLQLPHLIYLGFFTTAYNAPCVSHREDVFYFILKNRHYKGAVDQWMLEVGWRACRVEDPTVAHAQECEVDCDAHVSLQEEGGALTHTGDVWARFPSQAHIVAEGYH